MFYESEYGILPNRYMPSRHMFPDGIFYDFSLKYCASCGTVVNLNDNSDSAMFDGYVYRTPETLESLESVETLCSSIVGAVDVSKIDILEIGGNTGFYLNSLIRELENKGVSCNAVLIDKIEPSVMSGCFHWINDFLTNESLVEHDLESKFDLVIARHCMAHNADAVSLFSNIIKTVAPNGLIYVELTDLERIFESKNFGQFYPEHRYSFSKSSIKTLCRIFNLQLVATVNLFIHGGSVGYFIRPLSISNKRGSTVTRESTESKVTSSAMYDLHNNWLLSGFDVVKQYKKQKDVILWGCSAKAVYALNQFAYGRVDFFDFIWDNTPEKNFLFPPGFNVPVNAESTKDFCANVVLGAPNFSQLTSRITAEGHSIIGEFDRCYE
ncbi:class I SAM-dependent methyltransferase [Litoricolaceae bacterium]|nr:class I SAM-dependent methyltransferase [Litorivicinaceae bacterium]